MEEKNEVDLRGDAVNQTRMLQEELAAGTGFWPPMLCVWPALPLASLLLGDGGAMLYFFFFLVLPGNLIWATTGVVWSAILARKGKALAEIAVAINVLALVGYIWLMWAFRTGNLKVSM